MIFDHPAIRQRGLPLAMIAVSLCLLVTGWLFAMTLLIPGVFYLVIGLRGLGRMRAIDHERRDTTDGASRSHA